MKLSRIIDPRFHTAFKKLTNAELPLKTAYKLKGISKRLDEELIKYEDVRKAALTKYGRKKEDGSLEVNENGGVALDGDNMQLFIDEVNELVLLDVEVEKVSLAELGDIRLSAEDLSTLDELVSAN